MNELTEEELYQLVSKLPPRFQVAFAARLAASVLVFLEFEGELIHYCPIDERARFLLELLRAVQSAYLYSLTGKNLTNYLEKIRHSIANIYRYATAYSNSIIKIRHYRKLESMPRHYFVLKWFPIKSIENSGVKEARVENVILILYATVDAAITSNTIINTDSKQNNIFISRRLRQAINQVISATVKLELNSKSLIKLLVLHKKDIFGYLRRPLFFTEQNDHINAGNIKNDLSLQSNFLSVLRNFGQGFDWWADWYQDRLNGKQIGIVLWEKTTLLPESLLEQTPEVVNAYLKSLTDGKATFPLNRVRVFFIGDGAAGKTSLIRALHGEKVVAGMEPMTPGVEIREWDVPDTEIKAHFWDFGGQVIAHAMHKFFLCESCVYVLVQEARPGSNANERTEYWLEHVQRFGHCAPVLLVGNKADQTQLNLDLRSLREHYSNIVGFFALSCTEFMGAFKQHFNIFNTALREQLKKVGTHQILFAQNHFNVLETLRQQSPKNAFLNKIDYQLLCDTYNLPKTGVLNRDWLLDWLDKLGLVVHFPNIPTLDEYVLNPRWLTHGVYTLLYSKEASQGQLHIKDVVKILTATTVKDELGNELKYSASKCDFVLKAMEQFEVAYRLPEDIQVFILPDLLSATRPIFYFGGDKDLVFEFDFVGLLPRHLMTVFIVRRHREICNSLVWQNGVYLASKTFHALALAQVDYHRRRLSLRLTGAEASRYFSELYAVFKSLIAPLGKPEPSEWLGLPVTGTFTDDRPRANFRQLLALERAGESRYIDESGTYLLSEVLKIMPKEERDKQSREIHFHGAGSVIYQEGGVMTDVTQGDKTVMLSQAKELQKKLGEIEYDVDVQVEDEVLRSQALRELQKIRQALETLEKGPQEQKKGALETLSHFGDKAKEGAGKTVEALKTIKDGGEAVGWLMKTVPLIFEVLAGLAS